MGLWARGFKAGAWSFAATWVVAQIASQTTGVPEAFPPFTLAPLATACFGSAILGTAIYQLLRRLTRWANPIFVVLAIGVVGASLVLPYRLGYTQSKRFEGATPSAQVVLALMHVVVAGFITTSLIRSKAPRSENPVA
jgi:hypothetical protein